MITYKGIVFDDYTFNSDCDGFWSQICQFCANKHSGVLVAELSDHGGGICGVKGCDCSDEETDVQMRYVDFKIDFNRLRADLVNASSSSNIDGLTREIATLSDDTELLKEYSRIYGSESLSEYFEK